MWDEVMRQQFNNYCVRIFDIVKWEQCESITRWGNIANMTDMTSKNKLLGATMNELVDIVKPNWRVPTENLDEVFPGIFIGDE